MSKITVIPASINAYTHINNSLSHKRRVCGYARVSTDRDEQYTSFEAQKNYYEKYIKENPEWEFVDLYADEGITGTSTKNRDGFKLMIKDALEGKIDLIVTKSISRFARNTVDTLSHIRLLKDRGVEVYFEKENIWTFDAKGEMMITLMSSLAQEESRSISENVTWGHRNRFKNGKVSIPFNNFLGYKKGPNGEIAIDEEQAKVVRYIYAEYINGKTANEIAASLNEQGILTPGGCKEWKVTTVTSILTNEKYKGDALLQKRFTVNFLEHKTKKNEGEVEQYYVENSHPAIIDREDWEYVQAEIKRRKTLGRQYSGVSKYCCRLICGVCGGVYGHKVHHSNESCRKDVLKCNSRCRKDTKSCNSPTITFEEVDAAFIKAFNELVKNKTDIISRLEREIEALLDTSKLDAAIKEKEDEMHAITESIKALVNKNASVSQDQEKYLKSYAILEKKYNKLKEELDILINQKDDKAKRLVEVKLYLQDMKSTPNYLKEFDDTIWNRVVDRALVNKDRTITFFFKNNQKMTLPL